MARINPAYLKDPEKAKRAYEEAKYLIRRGMPVQRDSPPDTHYWYKLLSGSTKPITTAQIQEAQRRAGVFRTPEGQYMSIDPSKIGGVPKGYTRVAESITPTTFTKPRQEITPKKKATSIGSY